MGVIKRGILGGFSGKVGAVTGSSWKGIEIIKSRPLSVANPRSAGQVTQRNKLTNIVRIATVINASVIKPLFDRFAVQQSGYNAFCQANIALMANDAPSNPSEFVIAQGKMEATPIKTITNNAGLRQLSVSWDVDSNEGFKLATDEVYVVCLDTSAPSTFYSAAEAVRSAGVVVIDYPEVADTSHLECYLAFRRADGTIVSKSSYKRYTE
jgi:hypothetical protein